ncbi:MAG: diadenylate cyclase CdaA [Clostridia bacterium]|nr:diadenylate cyclase CdaA [Clostridia bacterium]
MEKENDIVISKAHKGGFFKSLFTEYIPYKVISVFFGALVWILTVGLGVNETVDETKPLYERFYLNVFAEFNSISGIIISVVDILLIIIVIYFVLRLLNRTGINTIAKILVIFTLAGIILSSALLEFPVMGRVMSQALVLAVISFVVMFSPEMKRSLIRISKHSKFDIGNADSDITEEELHAACDDIVKAVLNMSKNNVGAIIVLANQSLPEHIVDSGTALNSDLSQLLLECLFNKKANLHDGAVFIRLNKIIAAGCFLPLSQSQSIPKELGTRHRAALGMSEEYDVTVIVCSEESGVISIAKAGVLERYVDSVMLKEEIEQIYGLKADGAKKKKRKIKK